MLASSPTALRAGRNGVVSRNLRYVAARLCELWDPAANIAGTASLDLDPLTAFRELTTMGIAYRTSAGENPRATAMEAAVERTLAAIRATEAVRSWYGQLRYDAIADLELVVDNTQREATRPNAPSKFAWMDRHLAPFLQPGGHPLQQAMEGDFRERLLSSVLSSPDAMTRAALQVIDNDLRTVAALMMSEGRTPELVAATVADLIANGSGHASTVAQVRDALDTPLQDFAVAMKVRDVPRLRGANAYGCRTSSANPRWRSGETRGRPELRGYLGGRGSLLITDVDAFDPQHASVLARRRAETLMDQYHAQHRNHRVELEAGCLVFDVASGRVGEVAPQRSQLAVAQPRLRAPEPRLDRSMRYATLARTETLYVVQVLHCWIALETLTKGSGAQTSSYEMLARCVPRIVALHSVRQGIVAAWEYAARSGRSLAPSLRDDWYAVESWLGVGRSDRRLPDPSKWADLLVATPTHGALRPSSTVGVARAHLDRISPELAPLPRHLMEQWRFWLGNAMGLEREWCRRVHEKTLSQLGRMYSLRNAAVHSGLEHDDLAMPVALFGHLIVDLLHEVLPAWLSGGTEVWEAMDLLAGKSDLLRGSWRLCNGPANIDVARLTRP